MCAIAMAAIAQPATTLRLARLEAIPDQYVGGELLKAIYAKLGIQVELVDMPAKRALLESSAGRLDGEVQRVIGVASEYPSLLPVRPPINYIEPSAFTRGLEFPVQGWESIAAYELGIVRGVGSSERGTAGMARVEAVGNMDQLMQMLAAGRIQVAVNDRFSGILVTRRLRLDPAVRPLSPPLERIPVHHFLHEQHRELVPRVEQAVQQMESSGELPRLRQALMDKMLSEASK
jgi:ABC-type amino acid transport substrate-binding protein